MKKITLILLILSIFCCSCVIKQNLLLPESKYIIEDAPFCLTSALLIEYTLVMLSGEMSADTYMAFASEGKGCCITNDNFHIEVIKSAHGISKIEIKSGAVSLTGYTFDGFIRFY